MYKSGTTGTFGIVTTQLIDSFRFVQDGYITQSLHVNAGEYLTVVMKPQPAGRPGVRLNRLSSATRGMMQGDHRKWFAGDETYSDLVENHFINANRFPNTGLSLNIDRASYSNIRRFLMMNSAVPPDAVRIEEMLNYFNLNYTKPPGSNDFSIRSKLTSCPWNTANQLFYVNVSARKLDLSALPPTHLVFLIDVSGSMDMTNRLPLLKSAFKLLVANLRAKDSVAIVVYGGTTGIILNTTSGNDKDTILKTIDRLEPGGSTPGESGIKLAYSVAKHHFIPGGNNRVILATDGDFNVGLKTETELEDMISQHRQSGIYLTCLGVGMGNYKDSKIQTLARKGNGNFAYFDNFAEAEKVLLKEFTQTLYAVVNDAYMNVEFNPQFVKEYRLIGFDNKVGALVDTMAVVEGGEVGSGYSMVGIFEIEPTKKDTVIVERLAKINLHYKPVGDSVRKTFSAQAPYILDDIQTLEPSFRFSAAVAWFGLLLKTSPFLKNTNWNELALLAAGSADKNDPSQAEFITLIEKAKTIYTKSKRKKKQQRDEE